LSALVADGIIERRRGSGTFVVDPRRRQHVAILSELDLVHPRASFHFRALFSHFRHAMSARGYAVRFYMGLAEPGGHNADLAAQATSCHGFLEDFEAGRICGVAAVSGMKQPLRDHISAAGVPLVGCEASDAPCVQFDDIDRLRLGVDALLSHGRRKLAFMTWHYSGDVLTVLRERGLDVRSQWFRYDLPPASPGAGWGEFREIWSAVPGEKPDGLLITDEMLLADAIPAIVESEAIIPEQLLVVAQASRGLMLPLPFPIERIESDPDFMAKTMASLLIDEMEGRPFSGSRIKLPMQLVHQPATLAKSVVQTQ
jgi:DNA-binding LacI/PurR family transcriptional regulator